MMLKSIVIAALAAGLMAVPVAPVQAAAGANCLILPLLQADCRAAISEHVKGVRASHSAKMSAVKVGPPMIKWHKCTRAEKGAKYLFVCE